MLILERQQQTGICNINKYGGTWLRGVYVYGESTSSVTVVIEAEIIMQRTTLNAHTELNNSRLG